MSEAAVRTNASPLANKVTDADAGGAVGRVDRRRHALADQGGPQARGTWLAQPALPTETGGGDAITRLELVAGPGQVLLLVAIGEILETQRERIHPERGGQLVHAELERVRACRDP